jgi:hypothetical protein
MMGCYLRIPIFFSPAFNPRSPLSSQEKESYISFITPHTCHVVSRIPQMTKSTLGQGLMDDLLFLTILLGAGFESKI